MRQLCGRLCLQALGCSQGCQPSEPLPSLLFPLWGERGPWQRCCLLTRWDFGSRPSSHPCLDGPALSFEERFRTGCQAGRDPGEAGMAGVGAGVPSTVFGGVFTVNPGQELHLESNSEHTIGSQIRRESVSVTPGKSLNLSELWLPCLKKIGKLRCTSHSIWQVLE